jgi:hypothetical protein
MVQPVNGFVGTVSTSTELTLKFPPISYAGCSANVGLVAPYTKYWCDGITWAGLNSQAINALIAPGILSNVVYDSNNRAITWTLDNVVYTANYSTGTITVAASDGTITYIGIDPAQRLTSVTTA